MRFNSFMNFILNEEITSNGKPLGDPDQAAGGKKKRKMMKFQILEPM